MARRRPRWSPGWLRDTGRRLPRGLCRWCWSMSLLAKATHQLLARLVEHASHPWPH